MSPIAVPDVELVFSPGETKNVVNRVAQQLLTNPDFVDAATQINQNFSCAWCSEPTLHESFIDETTGDVRLIREDDGNPDSARLCLACFIAAAPEYQTTFERKGLSEELVLAISGRRILGHVRAIKHSSIDFRKRTRRSARTTDTEVLADATTAEVEMLKGRENFAKGRRAGVAAFEYFETLRQLGDRYFSEWSEQRIAIVEAFATSRAELLETFKFRDDAELKDWFEERDTLQPSVLDVELRQRGNVNADLAGKNVSLKLRAIYAFSQNKYGGHFGLLLSGGLIPIVVPSELVELKDAPTERLQALPPVMIDGPDDSIAALTPESLQIMVLGNGEIYRATDLTGNIAVAFNAVATQIQAVADVPRSIGLEGSALRAAYHEFAKLFWDSYRPSDGQRITTSPEILSAQELRKQTSQPFAIMERAYSHARKLPLSDDGLSLVFRGTPTHKSAIAVFITPQASQFFPATTVRDLQEKLELIGADLSFTFAVTMSLALKTVRVDLELNDLIKAIGLDPRTSAQRMEFRSILWDCLKIFAQTEATGEIGGTFKDDSGKVVNLRLEKSVPIAITGSQYPREMRLDKSEVPDAVSFVAGNFFDRNRGNRKLLTDFGNLSQLAEIPTRQPSGRWARSIGLTLCQFWRQQSASATLRRVGDGDDRHVTAEFRLVTRREIFDWMPPQPDPHGLLSSDDPKRVRAYWDAAMTILAEKKFANIVTPRTREYRRKGWADDWLDELLDIRPHPENAGMFVDLAAISDGSKLFRRKRGRPKKSKV